MKRMKLGNQIFPQSWSGGGSTSHGSTTPIPTGTAGETPGDWHHHGSRSTASDASLPFSYSVSLPVHFERNYAYPVVVWFHPDGGTSRDMPTVMAGISDRNYVGLALDSERRLGERGQVWIDDGEDVLAAANQLSDLLDRIELQYGTHPDRVFLAGSEAGGTMALRIAFTCPQRVAGVGAFNGGLPIGAHLLAQLRQAREVPVFLAAQRDALSWPESSVCRDLQLLYTAGFDVALRQYPATATLPDDASRDFNDWIMEQLETRRGANIIR